MSQQQQEAWSERKKWFMGILATLIVGIFAWTGTQLFGYFSDNEKIQIIKPIKPLDGASFSHFPRDIELSWEIVKGSKRYIIHTEYQHLGKWNPLPYDDRHVTKKNSQTIRFIGAQSGRWKVSAIGKNESVIGESPWWYFSFSK